MYKLALSITFAAILDSCGKIIVGHNNLELNNERDNYSFTFYYTHLLFLLFTAIVIGEENEKWLGVSYCKY
jgi:hypothetical protein